MALEWLDGPGRLAFWAQVAFTIWMLVDAYRRGAEVFWLWVILLVPVVGAWAYFFVVKIADFPALSGLKARLFQHRASLEELRYRIQRTPTLANHLALGERLMEQRAHAEAIPHLEAALAREPEHCQVLYALAVCQFELGRPESAIGHLEKILARDRRWSNYRAWHLLIDARTKLGDSAAALAACRELVKLAPTLQHRCMLAQRLLDAGLTDEARKLLDESLADHRFQPGPIRRRNRRWASRARQLQKQASAPRS